MHKFLNLLSLAALMAVTSAAFAAERDAGVNRRQADQHARIHQGVRSGQLTHQEAKSLRSEQRSIRHEERKDKADGKMTPAERKDLHKDLNQASKDIYADKHNADVRPRAQ
ncbi:MAG TPA: hypothetical protein VEV20_00385 [Burkholderiales bacterium]|nr:hypothetical protein [Burkholderiales bacterium]